MGGNVHQSEVMRGLVVERDVEGTIAEVKDAKIAVFSCGIETSGTEAKSTVLIKNANELMNYNKGEEQLMEDSIKAIAEAGVTVIVSGGSISEMALHFIERYGMMVLKIMSKFELRRVCRATRSTALVRLGPPTPEEMGSCESVVRKEIGGKKVIVFNQGEENCNVATIILRASTENLLNDLERAIDDGVNCVKSTCLDPRFCPGGGATEIELARLLAIYADTCPGLEQYAIKKFAECFETIPRAMAENSGRHVEEVISKLYAAHGAGNISVGLDLQNESGISDALAAGILDNYAVKESALRLSIDAAMTVLSVDQVIDRVFFNL
jgi:T-complex protein 1 subunit theta